MSDKEILEKAIQKAIDAYEVKTDGTVLSHASGKEVKGSINSNGYRCLKVYIPESSISKRVYVHRLVALKHLPNIENVSDVNHIDGNKLNNSVDNLEWTTHKQNMNHAWNNGLLSKPPHVPGEKAGKSKLTWEIAARIRSLHLEGRPNTFIAGIFKVHHSTVARIVKGVTWKLANQPKYLRDHLNG